MKSLRGERERDDGRGFYFRKKIQDIPMIAIDKASHFRFNLILFTKIFIISKENLTSFFFNYTGVFFWERR